MQQNNMNTICRTMTTGAGRYYQGKDALNHCGEELKHQRIRRVCIVGGIKALSAARIRIVESLEDEGISWDVISFRGHCTESEIDQLVESAGKMNADAVMGVGGGKVMDLTKAAAYRAGLRAYTVPTIAATCAAYAPLSVVYNEDGIQDHTLYHRNEVSAVFVDTQVLADAPARYLAAGMADSMAKACEYSSMHETLHIDDIDISKYLGYRMAGASDEILLALGSQAYRDNCEHCVTDALENAVFIAIASTGIISGMGGFPGRSGSRFAIAHGFNEVLRGAYLKSETWLHGEIVAVGILAQLKANGIAERKICQVRDFYQQIGVPTTLSDLELSMDNDAFMDLQKKLYEHSRMPEEYQERVFEAIISVR